MALIRGTPITVASTANSGSTSVNIPAGTKRVILFASGWLNGTVTLNTLTLGGQSMSVVGGINNSPTPGGWPLVVCATLDNPPTGSQTLAWDFTGSTNFAEGVCYGIVPYSADGTVEIRDAASVTWEGFATEDVTVDSTATDQVIGWACSYDPGADADANQTGQTVIVDNFTSANHCIDIAFVNSPGASTTTFSAFADYGGIIAVSVYEEASANAPSITDVDEDDTITSDQTNVVITGTNFDAATVEIRQGSVEVAQSVDSQTATAIVFDVVFDTASADLKYGAATLAVINADDQEDTIGITINPPSGNLYVDVGTPNGEASNRITAVPDIESGDQIEARGAGGGATPAGLTLNADATFSFSSGNTPAAFDVRIWDVNDATWGVWATQAIGGAVEGSVTEASAFGATFAPAATQRVTFTAGIQAASALSGRAVALGAIVEALEAGDTDAAAQAAVAALSAQVETDAQYAAIAQAAAAIHAGLAAGEAWAALAAAEAGITAGHELGATFSGDTQAAQEAALAAGTEAAALFLGAVAAFALLQAGATASDAFAASASVSQAFTGAAQLGASFTPVTGDTSQISAAAAIQAAFRGAVSASGQLAMAVDVDDAFEAVSVALSAISAGVILGATFAASSTADVSIIGAVASVRAIRRMGASVRVIRTKATIN